MATTMKLIAKNVLGSSAASVTFSSIPGTYTDLMLVMSTRGSRTDITFDQQVMRFNSDTGSNYSGRYLYGSGSSAVSGSYSSQTTVGGGYTCSDASTASTFGVSEVLIPNYAGSTAKSVSVTSASEHNATAAYIWLEAGLWSGTSAITSILIYPVAGAGYTFKSGSSFFLYGITKA